MAFTDDGLEMRRESEDFLNPGVHQNDNRQVRHFDIQDNDLSSKNYMASNVPFQNFGMGYRDSYLEAP